MTNSDKLNVFKAQTKNVRKLESSFKSLNRSINTYLRKGDMNSVHQHTLLLALVFSAFSETKFSKLIHTPHAFTIEELKEVKKQKSLVFKWEKAIQIGINKIPSSYKTNYKQNLNKKVLELLEEHIKAPSEIRNKIAHGQWAVALNSDNSRINQVFTNSIANIDCVTISRWKDTYDYFYSIVDDIVQSPTKAHYRDYYAHIAGLENYIETTKEYSLQKKINLLRKKEHR